ncbi:MAG TPA: hypothetical protein DD393_05530 [Ruminococcaceae bacterium]|nr:hypothetical protein [Oscillospiraceae bacterium]
MADKADGSIIVDTEIDPTGFEKDSAKLRNAIQSLNKKVENLRPSFNKAITGSASALSSFNAKAGALEQTIADIEDEMTALATKRVPTEEYQKACNSVEKYEEKLAALEARQEKLANRGVSENSSQWKNLTSDINLVYDKLERAVEAKQQFEESGNTHTLGSETTQYAQLSSSLEKAKSKLSEMNQHSSSLLAKLGQINSPMREFVSVLQNAPSLTDRLWNGLANVSNVFSTVKEKASSALSVISHIKDFAVAINPVSIKTSPDWDKKILNAFAAIKQDAGKAMGVLNRGLGKAVSAAGYLAKNFGKMAVGKIVSGVKSMASHIAKSVTHSSKLKGGFDRALSSIKRIAPALLVAEGVMGILRKAASAYMEENESLKSTLNACWSGIGQILGPIITKMVNLLAQGVSYVLKFLSLFGIMGKTTSKSIDSSTSKAKKATKELKGQLASFDEINKLSDNGSDSDTDSGTSSTGSLPSVEVPDFAKLIADQLKNGDWAGAATTLSDKVNSIINGVDWEGIGAKVAYYFNGALTFIATAIEKINWYNIGVKLGKFLNKIITGVDWKNLGVILGAKFKIAVESLGGLFATIKWKDLGKALSDCFMGLWNSIDWAQAGKMVSDGITGILDTINTFLEETDWQQIGEDVATFIRSIDWNGIFDGLCEGIGAALGGLVSFLYGLIKDAWKSVVDWWHDVAYEDGEFTMQGLLDGIWQKVKDISKWVVEHIVQPFVDGIKKAFDIHSPSKVMEELGIYIIEGLFNGISATWENIKTFFSTMFNDVKNVITQTWDNVKTKTKEAWDNVGSKVSTVAANVYNSASTKFSSLKTSIHNNVESMRSKVSTSFENIKSNITGKLQTAYDLVKNKNWKSIGTNICTGISNGLNEKWEWLKNKVGNVASSLLTKAENVLKIHSPSRVFRDRVGLNIGLGIGVGVEKSTPQVVKTVSGLAQAISEEVKAGDYTASMSINTTKLNGGLNEFSDTVVDSFNVLMDRLQAIADSVTFTMPAVAKSTVVPYAVSSGYSDLVGTKDSSKEDFGKYIAVIDQRFVEILRVLQSQANSDRVIKIYLDGKEISFSSKKHSSRFDFATNGGEL